MSNQLPVSKQADATQADQRSDAAAMLNTAIQRGQPRHQSSDQRPLANQQTDAAALLAETIARGNASIK